MNNLIQTKINKGEYIRVKILYSNATEVIKLEADMEVNQNELLVVSTRYGNDLARVLGAVRHFEDIEAAEENWLILRKATEEDILRYEENKKREEKAFRICREKIEELGLEMKLVQAHYLLDESKILFFFTAESRVDFRELVKVLVSEFKMRIELRQIGVRDEARVIGGLGVCGRALCCNSVTDKLVPVSIKMAKEQSLTLNSMKISGPCGRLLCCLAYEYDTYCVLKKGFPSLGATVRVGEEVFKVSEINILKDEIKIIHGDGRVLTTSRNVIKFIDSRNEWVLER